MFHFIYLDFANILRQNNGRKEIITPSDDEDDGDDYGITEESVPEQQIISTQDVETNNIKRMSSTGKGKKIILETDFSREYNVTTCQTRKNISYGDISSGVDSTDNEDDNVDSISNTTVSSEVSFTENSDDDDLTTMNEACDMNNIKQRKTEHLCREVVYKKNFCIDYLIDILQNYKHAILPNVNKNDRLYKQILQDIENKDKKEMKFKLSTKKISPGKFVLLEAQPVELKGYLSVYKSVYIALGLKDTQKVYLRPWKDSGAFEEYCRIVPCFSLTEINTPEDHSRYNLLINHIPASRLTEARRFIQFIFEKSGQDAKTKQTIYLDLSQYDIEIMVYQYWIITTSNFTKKKSSENNPKKKFFLSMLVSEMNDKEDLKNREIKENLIKLCNFYSSTEIPLKALAYIQKQYPVLDCMSKDSNFLPLFSEQNGINSYRLDHTIANVWKRTLNFKKHIVQSLEILRLENRENHINIDKEPIKNLPGRKNSKLISKQQFNYAITAQNISELFHTFLPTAKLVSSELIVACNDTVAIINLSIAMYIVNHGLYLNKIE